MPDDTPRIELATAAGGGVARLTGQWTAAQFARPGLFRRLRGALPAARPDLAWDLRGAGQIDHVGAQMLWSHWREQWPPQLELQPGQRAVLERVAQFTMAPPPRRRLRLVDVYLEFGASILRFLGHARDFVALLGRISLDALRLAVLPHEGPWRDVSGNMYRICATALPITALVGFLIGVVLAYLTARQLRQFGADAFIVDILGIGLIRELGPMLAAILIAGRSGSSITAQIGVMRVTDELDAMRVMGISHSFRLVLPRTIALAVGMPLISVWTTLAGLAGGMLVANYSLDITPTFFMNALPKAVPLSNLTLATMKSIVFGVLIAMIGSHFGLRVKPNTESLGQGTTASVVTAITVVILIDAAFAVLFKDVGGP
ncbi:MAG TPA: ABC transporter permease [Ramlibacter sp.]|uniref:MlaE family ABC transporter permease n=1 Tax=Ramlibacter sp. TaxID=1917967 RepID=UPI002C975EED|nr:ABC transporter permease [Ramlibacter sp.]HVZ43867.1 ABC transporter permease [Ramlibacter sp.]